MAEIPDDIWQAVEDLFEDSLFRPFRNDDAKLEAARTILAERERIAKLLRDPEAVRIGYLRGDIACQKLIDEAAAKERERCATIASIYADGYEVGLYHYGPADKDAGRGRQEGHIKAGRDIADAIMGGKENADG